MVRESYLRQMTTDSDSTPDTQLTGYACILRYVKTLDSSPGVYRMLDADSRVLYVGKARNLKARVSNYARPGHSGRIERMIAATASMMFLTTRTETEALLLEAERVKRKQDEKEAELEAAAEIVDEMFLAEVKVIGKC